LQGFSRYVPHRHSLGPPSTLTSPSSQPVLCSTTRRCWRSGSQATRRGLAMQATLAILSGIYKRLALGCRGRADPCQLALYVHCRHAHEQEAGGRRCGSGGSGCANNDRNLGTVARSPNESRHRWHARLSVGSSLMDASASRSGRLDWLLQHEVPLLLHLLTRA
jgi:hypothetical protein